MDCFPVLIETLRFKCVEEACDFLLVSLGVWSLFETYHCPFLEVLEYVLPCPERALAEVLQERCKELSDGLIALSHLLDYHDHIWEVLVSQPDLLLNRRVLMHRLNQEFFQEPKYLLPVNWLDELLIVSDVRCKTTVPFTRWDNASSHQAQSQIGVVHYAWIKGKEVVCQNRLEVFGAVFQILAHELEEV